MVFNNSYITDTISYSLQAVAAARTLTLTADHSLHSHTMIHEKKTEALLPTLCAMLGTIVLTLGAILATKRPPGSPPDRKIRNAFLIFSLLLSIVATFNLRQLDSAHKKIKTSDFIARPYNLIPQEDVASESDMLSCGLYIVAILEVATLFSCTVFVSHRFLCDLMRRSQKASIRSLGDAEIRREASRWSLTPGRESLYVAFIAVVLLQSLIFVLSLLDRSLRDHGIVHTGVEGVLSEDGLKETYLWDHTGALVYFPGTALAACACICVLWKSESRNEVENDIEADPVMQRINWETGHNYDTFVQWL